MAWKKDIKVKVDLDKTEGRDSDKFWNHSNNTSDGRCIPSDNDYEIGECYGSAKDAWGNEKSDKSYDPYEETYAYLGKRYIDADGAYRHMWLGPNSKYTYVKEAKGSTGRVVKPCYNLSGAFQDAKWSDDRNELICTYDIDKVTNKTSDWNSRFDKLHGIIEDASSYPLDHSQQLTKPLEPLIEQNWCDTDDNRLKEECQQYGGYDDLKETCLEGNYLNTKAKRQECAQLKDHEATYVNAYDEASKTYCEANPDKEECSCYNQQRKINAGTSSEYPWCYDNKENPGCAVIHDVYKMAQEMENPDAKTAIIAKMSCFFDMCHNDDRTGDRILPSYTPETCGGIIQICNQPINLEGSTMTEVGTVVDQECNLDAEMTTVEGGDVDVDVDVDNSTSDTEETIGFLETQIRASNPDSTDEDIAAKVMYAKIIIGVILLIIIIVVIRKSSGPRYPYY